MSDQNQPFISGTHNRYYLHTEKLFCFANKQGCKIAGKALQEKEKDLEALKQVYNYKEPSSVTI